MKILSDSCNATISVFNDQNEEEKYFLSSCGIAYETQFIQLCDVFSFLLTHCVLALNNIHYFNDFNLKVPQKYVAENFH